MILSRPGLFTRRGRSNMWATEPVWTFRRIDNVLLLPRMEPQLLIRPALSLYLQLVVRETERLKTKQRKVFNKSEKLNQNCWRELLIPGDVFSVGLRHGLFVSLREEQASEVFWSSSSLIPCSIPSLYDGIKNSKCWSCLNEVIHLHGGSWTRIRHRIRSSLLFSILSIICWTLDRSRFPYIRNRRYWWLLGLVRRTATVSLMCIPKQNYRIYRPTLHETGLSAGQRSFDFHCPL